MNVSKLKVCKSQAGYYVGKTYYDEEIKSDLPYSRDSIYFGNGDECNLYLNQFTEKEMHYHRDYLSLEDIVDEMYNPVPPMFR